MKCEGVASYDFKNHFETTPIFQHIGNCSFMLYI